MRRDVDPFGKTMEITVPVTHHLGSRIKELNRTPATEREKVGPQARALNKFFSLPA